MGSMSIWHWIIVLAVGLLLFGGRGKISELMGDFAKGIKSFKKGLSEDEKAEVDAAKVDPVKTIDHQTAFDCWRRDGKRGTSDSRRSVGHSQGRSDAGRARAAQPASIDWGRRPEGLRPLELIAQCSTSAGASFVLIGIVALIVIGPEGIAGTLRTLGQWMGKLRRMASEFQGQFQEAMREAELADLKKQVDDMTAQAQSYANFDPVGEVRKEIESTQQQIEARSPSQPPADAPSAA